MLESLKVINEPLRTFATVLVECCAYAGTGNVLKIQHMLHICSEHFENKDEKKVKYFSFFSIRILFEFCVLGRRKRIIKR